MEDVESLDWACCPTWVKLLPFVAMVVGCVCIYRFSGVLSKFVESTLTILLNPVLLLIYYCPHFPYTAKGTPTEWQTKYELIKEKTN